MCFWFIPKTALTASSSSGELVAAGSFQPSPTLLRTTVSENKERGNKGTWERVVIGCASGEHAKSATAVCGRLPRRVPPSWSTRSFSLPGGVQTLPPCSTLRNCSQDSFLQHACCARRCTFDHERRLHYKNNLPVSHLLHAMSSSHGEKILFGIFFWGCSLCSGRTSTLVVFSIWWCSSSVCLHSLSCSGRRWKRRSSCLWCWFSWRRSLPMTQVWSGECSGMCGWVCWWVWYYPWQQRPSSFLSITPSQNTPGRIQSRFGKVSWVWSPWYSLRSWLFPCSESIRGKRNGRRSSPRSQ